MGLAGMRDRVRLMGGWVSLESPHGSGVVVEARFATAQPAGEWEYFPAYTGTQPGKRLIIEITCGASRGYCNPCRGRALKRLPSQPLPGGRLATLFVGER